MNTSDSFKIILEKIAEAQNAYQRISPYFLIWGIIMTMAGIGEYILVYRMQLQAGYAIWPVLGISGGIISGIYSARQDKMSRSKTYYDLVFQYLWMGFTVTLILIIASCVINGLNPTPFVLLATGLPTLVTGGMVKSNSLRLGGIAFWLSGIIAFYIPQEYTGLLFSLAILLGYVWPGIILKKSEKLK